MHIVTNHWQKLQMKILCQIFSILPFFFFLWHHLPKYLPFRFTFYAVKLSLLTPLVWWFAVERWNASQVLTSKCQILDLILIQFHHVGNKNDVEPASRWSYFQHWWGWFRWKANPQVPHFNWFCIILFPILIGHNFIMAPHFHIFFWGVGLLRIPNECKDQIYLSVFSSSV